MDPTTETNSSNSDCLKEIHFKKATNTHKITVQLQEAAKLTDKRNLNLTDNSPFYTKIA